jgi:hypothetical protein
MMLQGLLVCYISGMDLRRIDSETTPFLADALSSHPWTAYRNLPSNELFPTLVTGVDPTEHGVWGVQLQAGVETNRKLKKIVADLTLDKHMLQDVLKKSGGLKTCSYFEFSKIRTELTPK